MDCVNNESIERLSQMCDQWLQLLNERYVNEINEKLDQINKYVKHNYELKSLIDDKHESIGKELRQMFANITENEVEMFGCDEDIISYCKQLECTVDSLKAQFDQKLTIKSELRNKAKLITKTLDELKASQQQMIQQNNDNNANEYKVLANVMRVMYKTYSNSKVIGLLFNSEESLEKVHVFDKINKSQQICDDFWNTVNAECQL